MARVCDCSVASGKLRYGCGGGALFLDNIIYMVFVIQIDVIKFQFFNQKDQSILLVPTIFICKTCDVRKMRIILNVWV